jgi:hypothetical protein
LETHDESDEKPVRSNSLSEILEDLLAGVATGPLNNRLRANKRRKMYDIKIRLPTELIDKLQLLSHRAESKSGKDVSVEAIALLAIVRGLTAVEFEIENIDEPRKLILVK